MQHLRNLLKKDLSFGKDPEEVHFTFVLTANNSRPNKYQFGRELPQLDEVGYVPPDPPRGDGSLLDQQKCQVEGLC